MRTLKLFTTLGCHLCEVAAEMLEKEMAFVEAVNQAETLHLDVQKIEISDSDDLMEAYAVRIPVVKFEGSKSELGWPFSAEELRQFLLKGLKNE